MGSEATVFRTSEGDSREILDKMVEYQLKVNLANQCLNRFKSPYMLT